MTSRSAWYSMSHATKATEVRKVCGVPMAQHNTVAAAFHMRSVVERLVPQVPAAQRRRGCLSAAGCLMALQDSLQALPWAMCLEQWFLAMRLV
jgi:hypothetical protein